MIHSCCFRYKSMGSDLNYCAQSVKNNAKYNMRDDEVPVVCGI